MACFNMLFEHRGKSAACAYTHGFYNVMAFTVTLRIALSTHLSFHLLVLPQLAWNLAGRRVLFTTQA